MERTCATCFYDKGKQCEVLKEKIDKGCNAWADEREAKKREAACKKYYDEFCGEVKYTPPKEVYRKRASVTHENKEKRGGKRINDVLDEKFMNLYQLGCNDVQIGKVLGIGKNYVGKYRRILCLEVNSKEGVKIG